MIEPTDPIPYMLPLIFLGLIFLASILTLLGLRWWTRRGGLPKAIRYSRGEFGELTETDLRLTYKRFKELYPYSQISYKEYKKLQTEKAFKRAVSSQKIKRMVR